MTTIINGMASLPGRLLDVFRNAIANIHFTVGPFTVDGRTGISIDMPNIDWGSLLPHFAVGAWAVPADMLAVVHQGEMIIPAEPAEAIRRGRSRLEETAAPASAVTVNVFNPTPEPASTSTKRELQKLAAFGVL